MGKHQRIAGKTDGVSVETGVRWSAEEDRAKRLGLSGRHRRDEDLGSPIYGDMIARLAG